MSISWNDPLDDFPERIYIKGEHIRELRYYLQEFHKDTPGGDSDKRIVWTDNDSACGITNECVSGEAGNADYGILDQRTTIKESHILQLRKMINEYFNLQGYPSQVFHNEVSCGSEEFCQVGGEDPYCRSSNEYGCGHAQVFNNIRIDHILELRHAIELLFERGEINCSSCETSWEFDPCDQGCQSPCETNDCQICETTYEGYECGTQCQYSCQATCQICETCNQTGCETGCQVSCETGCEVGCEDSCDSPCQTSYQGCTSSCEDSCEDCDTCETCETCDTTCDEPCEKYCEQCDLECDSDCEDPCDVLCQYTCDDSCEDEDCQVPGDTCNGGCETVCETSCQDDCETCEPDEDVDPCEVDCQTQCEYCETCDVDCQTQCEICEVCDTTCDDPCEHTCQNCEDDDPCPDDCGHWEVCETEPV